MTDKRRPLVDEKEYGQALAEIAAYFANEPERGTAEARRFDELTNLIRAYEDKHWRIG